jgi:hypothetical protein
VDHGAVLWGSINDPSGRFPTGLELLNMRHSHAAEQQIHRNEATDYQYAFDMPDHGLFSTPGGLFLSGLLKKYVIGTTIAFLNTPRSLSDLGVRSEASGRVSTNCHDFEAHSGPTQRKIGAIWAAIPPPQ